MKKFPRSAELAKNCIKQPSFYTFVSLGTAAASLIFATNNTGSTSSENKDEKYAISLSCTTSSIGSGNEVDEIRRATRQNISKLNDSHNVDITLLDAELAIAAKAPGVVLDDADTVTSCATLHGIEGGSSTWYTVDNTYQDALPRSLPIAESESPHHEQQPFEVAN